jgi:hypothetical protein
MDPTVPLAHKSNITVSAAKLVPPDNNVRDACLLIQVVKSLSKSFGLLLFIPEAHADAILACANSGSPARSS